MIASDILHQIRNDQQKAEWYRSRLICVVSSGRFLGLGKFGDRDRKEGESEDVGIDQNEAKIKLMGDLKRTRLLLKRRVLCRFSPCVTCVCCVNDQSKSQQLLFDWQIICRD